MARRHQEMEQRVGIRVYCAVPHSPWQRPTNGNTNGLPWKHCSEATSLSEYSKRHLTHGAEEFNIH